MELKCTKDETEIEEDEEEEEETVMPKGEKLDEAKNGESYAVIAPSGKNGEDPFAKVIGHNRQKEELLLTLNWFKRSKELKAKGISIPQGVLLFGDPGNGKTLLIKATIKSCDCPAFVFQGGDNVIKGIIETFEKAKQAERAVIVIDELDLLIDKSPRIARVLQESMDGVESDGNILVIAAANNLYGIPKALLRQGRLEKLLKIPNPRALEAIAMLKSHLLDFGVTLPKDVDLADLASAIVGNSFAGIKAIANDIVLRNGFDGLTADKIYDSISNVMNRVKCAPLAPVRQVAIHEAGHAIVAGAFPQYFVVRRLSINGATGDCVIENLEEEFADYGRMKAEIVVNMAGVIAEKVICGIGSKGCENDLETARANAYKLIADIGYSSCWETLPPVEYSRRQESEIKLRRCERKIESLLKRCEKESYRLVKSHKKEIAELGELLFARRRLKQKEIAQYLGK